MRLKAFQLFGLVCILMGALFLGACAKKKVVEKTPPPPPPAAKPTATLALSRSDITKGQETVLTWNTANAETVTIDGVGTVGASGSRTLTPSDSITYNLMAKGPGGEADASARVTVNQPTAVKTPGPTLADLFNQNVKDVYFDYDKYGIRASDQAIADADAKFLADHPDAKVLIEGHCDERGSEEYNIALGDNRAGSTRDFLTKLGVSPNQIKTISYGKEKPFCTANDNDSCLQQNRRAHFVLETGSMSQGQ
jgi:peptidoglycan-associated lipoprotein